MRMSRKELERELKWECNATQLEKLWRKYAEEESTRLRKQLAEAAEENNKLRMVMNSNAKEICRLRNMLHQQAQEEKTSDEYIDGYADAMQDIGEFLQEKLTLREEVGSEKY